VVEDVELARLFTQAGGRAAVYAGRDSVSFRMYPDGLASLAEGWKKNLSSGSDLSYRETRLLITLWMNGILGSFLCVLLAAAGAVAAAGTGGGPGAVAAAGAHPPAIAAAAAHSSSLAAALTGLFPAGLAAALTIWAAYSAQVYVLLRPLGSFGFLPALLYPAYAGWFLFLMACSRFRTEVRSSVRWKGREITLKRREQRQ
jgi:4,4'-diaponeurosporenoate glycosyltransferase